MQRDFEKFFKQDFITGRRGPFAVAASGGLDSSVLCELCHAAALPFVIFHCNFQLRGEESERDELFVRRLGSKYRVDVFVERFDTERIAQQTKKSIQETARDLRYRWFSAQAKEAGVRFTLLGHHADDNIETLLMNFFRGTGLHGLTGMPVYQELGNCLRPLLSFTRQQLENFAMQNQLTWMEDSSNSSEKYTRNFFRNRLIPELEKIYPNVRQNLNDNITRFTQTELLYKSLVDKELVSMIKDGPSGAKLVSVDVIIRQQHTSVIFELLHRYGFSEKQVPDFLHLLNAESGKYIENDRYQLIRHRRWIVIAPVAGKCQEMVIVNKRDREISFDQTGKLFIRHKKKKIRIVAEETTAQVDGYLLKWPLILRKWKQGDYFYPLGMKKKKKVARFLIDQKLSKYEKDHIWVLESNKKIVWLVGLRIDDRFKVTGKSTSAVEFSISNA